MPKFDGLFAIPEDEGNPTMDLREGRELITASRARTSDWSLKTMDFRFKWLITQNNGL